MVSTPVPPMPVTSMLNGLLNVGITGAGKSPNSAAASAPTFFGFQRAALDRDKARAEAIDAGEILVAIRLIDGAFAAEFGFERHHRNQFDFTRNRRSLRRPPR